MKNTNDDAYEELLKEFAQYSKFDENNKELEEENKTPIYNFLEELKTIDPEKSTYIEKSIKKSVNNQKKKKADFKITKKNVEKALIIMLIAIIIAIGSVKLSDKIITHLETENIKIECIENFYTELRELGIEPQNTNIKVIINNSTPEYLKNNLFEIYLIIQDNYNLKESRKMKDLLIQKAGLAESFNEYLINEGYHKKEYYSENGESYYLKADTAAWTNAMEAQKIAEKGTGRGGK